TLFGLVDRDDLLTGTGPSDDRRIDAEVGDLHLVDWLRLRRHDPLEARVPGLDHTGGHRHDARQRTLDLVVAGFGLALHLGGRAVDLDVLRERDRRQTEYLGDLLRDGPGVAIGRLGGRQHEVELGALDRGR